MNIAFVYDRVNKIGGAERVLAELHAMWPHAPLYTAVYDPATAPWAKNFQVKTTFLQNIPFARRHHEWFAWLTPMAFSVLPFDQYDVVLTITSAEAKGIITKPHTLHICYCLTPTRYLWSGVDMYMKETGFGVFHALVQYVYKKMLPMLKSWDFIAAQRPDIYIAISQRVKKRIETYYKKTVSDVIYPPVDTDFFVPSQEHKEIGEYYLVVSRLVPYKRVDLLVQVCTKMKRNLIVLGTGPDIKRLKKLAGPTIQFIDKNLTDNTLAGYYRNCRAFLYAGDEDFGIVAGEAQSCGKPVIAYAKSGVSEIVKDHVTGVLFASQTESDLEQAIQQFERMKISSQKCRQNAMRFDKRLFHSRIRRFVKDAYQKYSTTL
jgi:glycosyltransferase involved in cell wall biosynthesis